MILLLRDPLAGTPVAVRIDWSAGDYSRGEVIAPLPLRGLRVGVWQRRILLVRAVTRIPKGWTRTGETIYDYIRVELEIINNLGLVRWPRGIEQTVELDHAAGTCRPQEYADDDR